MSPTEDYTIKQLAHALITGQVDANGNVVLDHHMRTAMVSAFQKYMYRTGEKETNVIVKNVMEDALAINEDEVYKNAKFLQSNLDEKNKKREEITELRDIISLDRYPTKFTYTDENGSLITVTLESKDEANALLQDLESILSALRDASSLDQMKLQQVMIEQQILMQTISNIMKNMQDTIKAIIQNMR